MRNAKSSTTGGGGSRRRVPAGLPLINGRRKEQTAVTDQDLFLFQELHKRERDRNIISLLQPVSDEFEPNGNYQLYRIASAKKGSGFEFPAENEKNDYNWLKTPPATPLFPSLEMDANDPQLIIQREIPVLQPLSRFAAANCNLEVVDDNSNGRPKSSNSRSRPPQRPVVTPSSQRTSTLSHSSNQTKNTKTSTIIRTDPVPILHQQKAIKSKADHNDMIIKARKQNPTKTRRNGAFSSLPLMPSANSLSAGHGFSNEKPPNLRTHERSNSATRDRSAGAKSTEPSTEPRRPQSSSSIASASRGRKVVVGCSTAVEGSMPLDDISCGVKLEGNLINTCSPKGIRSINQTGNRTQVVGSRMVQRVVNARSKAAAQPALVENYKKQSSDRGRFPAIQTTGFGIMAHKKSNNGYNSKHMVVPK